MIVPTAAATHLAAKGAASAEPSAHANIPAIDGLRAIAILIVVGFHVGLPQLQGGFVGVDVFFVISGFLITWLLARELGATGRIDILDFYARRARRLLPALAVVLAATLAAGAVLLVPVGEQQELAKSAMAAAGFVANVFFWRSQSSYFAGPSDEIPLLHLWTLAVEEQFYIAWPLVMIAIGAVVPRRAAQTPAIMAALVAVSLASFAACWWLTPARQTLTFYTTPFRAWEFGAGALIALAGLGARRAAVVTAPLASLVAGTMVAGGLAAILIAAVVFDRTTVFPGVAAALPVLGTAAIIAGLGLSPTTGPARLLAATPMVTIGKLSYSWYLWHWPLLALARVSMPGPNLMRDLGLVLAALALSALTYRFVEEPVRRHKPWPFRTRGMSVLAGVGLMLAVAAAAGALWAMASWRTAHDPVLRAATRALEEKAAIPLECTNFRFAFDGLAPAERCVLGRAPSGPIVLLWGDSHAFHYVPAVQAWADANGARLLPRAAGACKPHMASARAARTALGCVAFNQAVRESLAQLKSAGGTTVVLAARWSVPSQLQSGLGDWNGDLRNLVALVRGVGLKVVLVAETPGRKSATPQCVARQGAAACGRARADVDAERAAALATLQAIARDVEGVILYDPINEVCTATDCPAMRDGVVLFSDDSHLSVAASKRLAPSMGRVLNGVTGASQP